MLQHKMYGVIAFFLLGLCTILGYSHLLLCFKYS